MFDLGIVKIERNTITFACGCGHDVSIASNILRLFGCPERHFSKFADAYAYREHKATHKRARKACKFCHGAPVPEAA